MKLKSYLKDQWAKILSLIFFGAIFVSILIIFRVDPFIPICFLTLYVLLSTFLIMYDFFLKKSFYNSAVKILSEIDQKYLLPEMIDSPNFIEGKILYELIQETDKSMLEKIAEHRNRNADFRDYIEMWVHEIKSPISHLSLSIDRNDQNSKKHIKEIENFVDQALYYSKIDTLDKDYIVKKVNLAALINSIVKSNKDSLISNKIKIEIDNANKFVYSDSKWLSFIVNQIVLNSIKYRRENPLIKFTTFESENFVVLSIEDNGIGIKRSEIDRVLEKGFTGSNDRATKLSTGMGLYIANKLSDELGHRIEIESELEKFTRVNIYFGRNDHMNISDR